MIDPQLFLQIDLTTPLRLSPKTFISRDDENYFVIGLFDELDARKFLKHLLSCIYSFCDWITPEEVLFMWPEDTVNDLLRVIISLRKDKILVTQEEFITDTQDITAKIHPEEQELIKDKNWIEPHIKAFDIIPKDSFVLNQGAKGAGLLSLEIAKNNIQKIISTNNSFQNVIKAKEKARQEQLSNADFIYCNPHNLSPICYADKFNVLFTELFCSGIFEEFILEAVLYAKKNLLAAESMFIPKGFDLKVFAYQSQIHRDMVQESKEFEILYGLKFGSFTKAMSKHIMGIYTRLTPEEITRLSEDQVIKNFDFKSLEVATFNEDFEITITQPGKICGCCTFFEVHLTDNISISNSPYAPKIRFMQRVFTPAASIYQEEGDKIKLKATYDGTFRLYFAD